MSATLRFALSCAAILMIAACGQGPTPPPSAENLGTGGGSKEPHRGEVYSEVWSSNGYDGQTYEFKTNCVGEYDRLETCPLYEMTRVNVVGPDGGEYELRKDFNINSYSGEVTRRWVLYGPSCEGLPMEGRYRFNYYRDELLALKQTVDYEPDFVDYPRNVTWAREGADLVVTWDPPGGLDSGMWYKALVFPGDGELISEIFEWHASSARLPEIPLEDGAGAEVNVAIYYPGGYAYSEYVPLEW